MEKPPLGPRFRVREADVSGTGCAGEERGRARRRGWGEERPFRGPVIRSGDRFATVGAWREDGLGAAIWSGRRGGGKEGFEFAHVCRGVVSFQRGERGVALDPWGGDDCRDRGLPWSVVVRCVLRERLQGEVRCGLGFWGLRCLGRGTLALAVRGQVFHPSRILSGCGFYILYNSLSCPRQRLDGFEISQAEFT